MSFHPIRIRIGGCNQLLVVVVLLGLSVATDVCAHPLIENALDIVIARGQLTIEARISMEEVLVVATSGGVTPPRRQWSGLAESHGQYVLKHLHIRADGKLLEGRQILSGIPSGDDGRGSVASGPTLATYRFEYDLTVAPQTIRVEQDLLYDLEAWSASCVVRIRQVDQPAFESALLTGSNAIEFGCDWSAGAATRPAQAFRAVGTRIRIWPTIRSYAAHGINHILTGYDHLLFVTALVLAARSVRDLVKVVTMFTLAHTLTLTLSVCNLVTLSERIVEPMIAASIVCVALQNIFWPKRATGWSRLAIAFGFGLFHGLGFAGGLKEAMSQMPGLVLGVALAAFSIGVEIGHQIVVLPLFVSLHLARKRLVQQREEPLSNPILRLGSSAISLAGMYFLIQAIR